MQSIGNSLGSIYRNIVSSVSPISTTSEFYSKGTLTPQEFEEAGDYLVHRCPTWSWVSGTSHAALNPSKQFLISRDLPSRTRPQFSGIYNEKELHLPESQDQLKFQWHAAELELAPGMSSEESKVKGHENLAEITDEHIDENAVPMFLNGGYIKESEPEDNVLQGNYMKEEEEIEGKIIRTRRYNLSITYDFYYKTPRMWLEGYDEFYQPLTYEQVFEDVLGDYAKKTVTIEAHPCLGNMQVSIHPCNHANMMKFLIDNFYPEEEKIEVNKALILLLKFLASVVPTIEYDFTLNTNIRNH